MNSPDFSFGPARLEASELSCERSYRTLFESLGFVLESGHALQIGGANGAGKTSLLRILATLGYADQGDVTWNGEDIATADNLYRNRLVFLGHKQALKNDLTATENLLFHSRLGCTPTNPPTSNGKSAGDVLLAEINHALDYFGIGKARNRPVHQLSQGQRQRVALARVAITRAPLWILDEPATALDDQGIGQLCHLIDGHLQRKGMVIFSSHQSLAISAGPVSEIVIQS